MHYLRLVLITSVLKLLILHLLFNLVTTSIIVLNLLSFIIFLLLLLLQLFPFIFFLIFGLVVINVVRSGGIVLLCGVDVGVLVVIVQDDYVLLEVSFVLRVGPSHGVKFGSQLLTIGNYCGALLFLDLYVVYLLLLCVSELLFGVVRSNHLVVIFKVVLLVVVCVV